MSHKTGKHIQCKNCGKKFYVSGCRLKTAKFCSFKCSQTKFIKGNKKPKNAFKFPPGEKHPNWKGGKILRNGYNFILNKTHPRASKDGYVQNSCLVMEKIIKRYLKSNEVIHHINEIKNDDRPENLKLMSKSDHKRIHMLGNKLAVT